MTIYVDEVVDNIWTYFVWFSFIMYMVNHTQVDVGSSVKYLCGCKGMENVWTYFEIGKVNTFD
jgi:phosphate starvation-inducible membrane PsiE